MSRLTLFLAAVAVAGQSATMAAQNAPAKWADTISSEIEKANQSGDPAKLQAARALAERVATAYPGDGLIAHYLGFALYREAGAMTGEGGGNPTKLLERAQAVLEKSLTSHPLAETHAIISSMDGQLIAADPSRAMELGMASAASMETALRMGPKNPRVWLIRGISALFTPPEYGGGAAAAQSQLEHAVELFATDAPKPGEPAWGAAEVHVWLAQAYEKTNDKKRAAAEYRAALAIAPNYLWAQRSLAALK
jgi:tetratricopeptide (TPR) repeat protein